MPLTISLTCSNYGFNIGRLARYNEDWTAVFTSMGVCGRQQIIFRFDASLLQKLYVAVTGLEMSVDDLFRSGERIWNVMRMLSGGIDREILQ